MTAQTLYMYSDSKKCAFGGSNYTFFSLRNQFEAHYVDQKVNMCWPNFEIFERMYNYNQISIYSFWNGLEVAKTNIYMKNGLNLTTSPFLTPQLGFSLHVYQPWSARRCAHAASLHACIVEERILENIFLFIVLGRKKWTKSENTVLD